MKNRTAYSLLLGALLAAPAFASPVVELNPVTGDITGIAGGATGWGFRMTADPTLWVSVIGTFTLFETNPLLGSYLDLIGTQGGPNAGILAPGAADWAQGYNPTIGLGLGMYFIDPSALAGDSNAGTIRVLYESFSDDPNTCGGCSVDSGYLDAPFSVTVAAPEPGTMVLFGFGGALLLIAGTTRYSNRRDRETQPFSHRD